MRTRYTILFAAAVLAGSLFSSCSKEAGPDAPYGADDLVAVELNVATGLSGDVPGEVDGMGDSGNEDPTSPTEHEKIAELRIIAVRASTSEVLGNYHRYFGTVDDTEHEHEYAEEHTVTMYLPEGEIVNFYAVGNESHVGLNLSEAKPGTVYDMDHVAIDDVTGDIRHSPMLAQDLHGHPLPIAGTQKGVKIGNATTVGIDMTFAVAKMSLNITNNSSRTLIVDYANLGVTADVNGPTMGFLPTRMYLFGNEEGYPANTAFAPYKIERPKDDSGVSIAVGGSASIVFYIYEGLYEWVQGDNDNFRYMMNLGFLPGVDTKYYSFIKGGTDTGKGIERGKLYNLNVSVDLSGNVEISCIVDDWTKKEVTVPDFE